MPELKERNLHSEIIYWKRATWKGRIPVQKVANLENDYKFGAGKKCFRIMFITEPLFWRCIDLDLLIEINEST